MTPKQRVVYFREWQAVRKILRADKGMTPTEADAFRLKLHEHALGTAKSSKRLTNSDLDVVLATFRAFSQPDNHDAQRRQINQPNTRAAYKLQRLADELGLDDAYLEAMAKRICKKPLVACHARDFPRLIAALEIHKKRQATQAAAGDDPF